MQVIIIAIPIAAPLADIAVHVVKAPCVGFEAADGGRGGVAVVPWACLDRHVLVAVDPSLG